VIDAHWLKDRFKFTPTDVLQAELAHYEAFGDMPGLVTMIKSELERREKEYAEAN
jgi:hypothetical protein